MMKNIIFCLILMAVMASCYKKDYIRDYTDLNGNSSAVYFPFQVDVRSFIVGEGMQFKVGACLGGLMENDKDRVVTYEIDNSLIATPADANIIVAMKAASHTRLYVPSAVNTLSLMPSALISFGATKFVIPKGKGSVSGSTTVLPADSVGLLAKLMSAPGNLMYALPLRIKSADADTVLRSKNYVVVGVRFENMLFGDYWHHTYTTVTNASNVVTSTIIYNAPAPQANNKVWTLTTFAPDSLTANGYRDANVTAGKKEMKLALSADGKIKISSATGATNKIIQDGECYFNKAKSLQDRKIFLQYKYTTSNGDTYSCKDTLFFRNRIQDGVNVWNNVD